MKAQDIADAVRFLIDTPNTSSSSRFSNTSLLIPITRAVRAVVYDVLFPESRMETAMTSGQQEYAMPGIIRVYRVYVNGQPLPLTSVDTLQGQQIMMDDQSGMGVPTSAAPSNSQGNAMPQWLVATPTTYPFLNQWGDPSPVAQPWFTGQRPRAYVRSGIIGIEPPPSGTAVLTVEGVRVPDPLIAMTDGVPLPENFFDAVVWRTVEWAKYSDSTQAVQSDIAYADAKYKQEVRNLRTWRMTYTREVLTPKPRTYRSDYNLGNNRGNWGPSGWNW